MTTGSSNSRKRPRSSSSGFWGKPLVNERASRPPVEEEVPKKPVSHEPVTKKPIVNEPVVSEPVVSQPIVEEPVEREPIVREPVTSESLWQEPLANESEWDEPALYQPIPSEPMLDELDWDDPIVRDAAPRTSAQDGPLWSEPAPYEPTPRERSWANRYWDDPRPSAPQHEELSWNEPVMEEPVSFKPAHAAPKRKIPKVGSSPQMEQLPSIEPPVGDSAPTGTWAIPEFIAHPNLTESHDRTATRVPAPELDEIGIDEPLATPPVVPVPEVRATPEVSVPDFEPVPDIEPVLDVEPVPDIEPADPVPELGYVPEFEPYELEEPEPVAEQEVAQGAYNPYAGYGDVAEYEGDGYAGEDEYDEYADEFEGDDVPEDASDFGDADEYYDDAEERYVPDSSPYQEDDLGSNGLDSTESFRRLDANRTPSMGVTEAHEALSWDDDMVEGPRSRVAGLHLFGATGSAASYEGGPSVYDIGDEPGEDKQGMRVRAAAVVISVVAALILVYILGVMRFTTRTLPRTYIGGLDVSGLTAQEAQKALEEETANYSCEIKAGDFTATVKGSDVGLDRDEELLANAAVQNQSAYVWPLALLFPTSSSGGQGVTFDEGALSNIVNGMVDSYNRGSVTSENVEIVFDEEQNLYQIVGDVAGKAVDASVVDTAMRQELRIFGKGRELKASEVMHDATVADVPDFSHVVESANRSRTSDIPLTVNGETVAVSDASMNSSWVTIGEGPSVVVDEESIRWWAADTVSWLVYHEDEWNYYYLDTDAFVSEMVNRLATGNVDAFEVPMIEERSREGESRDYAYERASWDPDLGRYIDVDLEAQFARLFDAKGEVIWETAVVTGDLYEGRSTATGTFSIYSKERGVTLVGLDENGDGQPDYESYVYYWMPFYGGLGLHDATWRSNFGGDLYAYNGSHGCVNLPYEKAEELYNMTYVGETVNVHW